MDIIYEISFKFRIQYIPDFAVGPWDGAEVVKRKTPFCIYYRAQTQGTVEYVELTTELFRAFLLCPPVVAKLFLPSLDTRYQMSLGMLDCLQQAPLTLLGYASSKELT